MSYTKRTLSLSDPTMIPSGKRTNSKNVTAVVTGMVTYAGIAAPKFGKMQQSISVGFNGVVDIPVTVHYADMERKNIGASSRSDGQPFFGTAEEIRETANLLHEAGYFMRSEAGAPYARHINEIRYVKLYGVAKPDTVYTLWPSCVINMSACKDGAEPIEPFRSMSTAEGPTCKIDLITDACNQVRIRLTRKAFPDTPYYFTVFTSVEVYDIREEHAINAGARSNPLVLAGYVQVLPEFGPEGNLNRAAFEKCRSTFDDPGKACFQFNGAFLETAIPMDDETVKSRRFIAGNVLLPLDGEIISKKKIGGNMDCTVPGKGDNAAPVSVLRITGAYNYEVSSDDEAGVTNFQVFFHIYFPPKTVGNILGMEVVPPEVWKQIYAYFHRAAYYLSGAVANVREAEQFSESAMEGKPMNQWAITVFRAMIDWGQFTRGAVRVSYAYANSLSEIRCDVVPSDHLKWTSASGLQPPAGMRLFGLLPLHAHNAPWNADRTIEWVLTQKDVVFNSLDEIKAAMPPALNAYIVPDTEPFLFALV